VASTQPTVATASSRFFEALRSAIAPIAGMVSRTARFDSPRTAVQASVPQAAPSAITPTK
jgi:hypothetical protein